jgi:hypothetical protein
VRRDPLSDAEIAICAEGGLPLINLALINLASDTEELITSMAQEIQRLRSCRCRAIACAMVGFGEPGPSLIEGLHAKDGHHPSCLGRR